MMKQYHLRSYRNLFNFFEVHILVRTVNDVQIISFAFCGFGKFEIFFLVRFYHFRFFLIP